jgi:hypothetical protein
METAKPLSILDSVERLYSVNSQSDDEIRRHQDPRRNREL